MTTLVAIGFLGCKRVYIDVPLEEAVRRYEASESYVVDGGFITAEIHEFEGDEFWAYDVGTPL